MSTGEIGLMALLLIAGVVAGFVNTLAGGGSMLTLPLLMMLGLPAEIANGTNRVAVVAQGISGVWGFHRHGRLERRGAGWVVLPTILGAVLGAIAASQTPSAWLKPTLLGALILVAGMMLLRPNLFTADENSEPRPLSSASWFGLFLTGLYGGFVQAGVGFLLLAVLCGVLRFDLLRGNALKLVCVLCFGTASLIVFAVAGDVSWAIGGCLACATVLGSQIGVRTAFRLRPAAMRWFLFVAVCLSCTGALLR